MYKPLAESVSNLLMRGEVATFSDSGDKVTVLKKQKAVSLRVINVKEQARKKKAVVVDKTWDYPIELESAVCWDILYTLRDFALSHPEVQESWDSIFGAKYPELLIKPVATTPEHEYPDTPQRKRNSAREKTENSSERGFLFGAVRIRGYREKWQAYYKFDDSKKVYAGTFRTSAEAKEAAYEAATAVSDLASTNGEPSRTHTKSAKTPPSTSTPQSNKEDK